MKVGGLAVLLFTSGTTSQPRACMLSHEALVRNWTTFGNVFRLQPGEKCWAPGPDVPPRRDRPDPDELRDGRGDADRRLVRPDARAGAARPRAAGDPLPRLSADHDGRARAPALRGDRPLAGARDPQRRPARPAAPDPGHAPARDAGDDLRALRVRRRGHADEPRRRPRDAREHLRLADPGRRGQRRGRARSSSAASASATATTATRRRTRRPSTPTAGCTPATAARSTPTGA